MIPETLFLAVTIMDRYMEKQDDADPQTLQVVAIASLLVNII